MLYIDYTAEGPFAAVFSALTLSSFSLSFTRLLLLSPLSEPNFQFWLTPCHKIWVGALMEAKGTARTGSLEYTGLVASILGDWQTWDETWSATSYIKSRV